MHDHGFQFQFVGLYKGKSKSLSIFKISYNVSRFTVALYMAASSTCNSFIHVFSSFLETLLSDIALTVIT